MDKGDTKPKSDHGEILERAATRAELFAKIWGSLVIISQIFNWFYSLPSWLLWFTVAIALIFLLSWGWISLQSQKRQEADPLDVNALLSEIALMTTETRPVATDAAREGPIEPAPITEPIQAELKPRFHAYTNDDDIDGLRWEWKWKPEATEPHPDAIDALACFCRECGLRIEPTNEARSRRVVYDRPPAWAFATGSGRAYTVVDLFARFSCDRKCFNPIIRTVDQIEELKRIKREIERRAKSRI